MPHNTSSRATYRRGILFDWDGTLVDNWAVIHHALNDTLAAWGKETWGADDIRHKVSRSQRDSFPVLFGDEWEKARDHFYERFLERHLDELVVLPDAPEVLKACHEAGLFVGIVSNKSGDFLRRELDFLKWNDRVHVAVGAGDAGADKPDAAPVLHALRGTGLAPSDCWFVGDTATDMETARNSGAVSVLVPPPPAYQGSPVEGADISLDGLASIVALVKR